MEPKSPAELVVEDLQQLTDWFIELNRRLIQKGVLDGYVHLDMLMKEEAEDR